MPERALVIIPTYNESENLSRIVPAVLGQDARLEVLLDYRYGERHNGYHHA